MGACDLRYCPTTNDYQPEPQVNWRFSTRRAIWSLFHVAPEYPAPKKSSFTIFRDGFQQPSPFEPDSPVIIDADF